LVLVSAVSAGEFRTWTDSTGKHTLKAKLDSVEDGKAILIRENGQKVKIAVEKLSKADREFLEKQAADSPFEKVEKSDSDASEKEGRPSTGEPRTVTVNWSVSQELPLPSPDTAWKITVPDVPAADFRPRSVPLAPRQDFWEGLNGMAVSNSGKMGVVGYGWKMHGDTITTERLVLCDLQSGRVVGTGAGKYGEMIPFALHDEGRQILMRRNDFGGGNAERLEIWSLKGKGVVRSLVWTPFSDDPGWGHDVIWAAFVDAKRLALCSGGGKVALWDLAKCQPICHTHVTNGGHPALSPDRKWLAYVIDDTLGLIDIAKKEVIATTPISRKLQAPALAFSPSGKRIGCVAADRILVWDTATGKLEKDFGVTGINMGGEIAYPDEGFILAGNQFLIDVNNQLKLWHYQGADRARTVGGTTFIAATGDNTSGVLLATKLPHPQSLAMLKEALGQSDLFAFRKGMPVKLNVSGISDAAEQNKAKEALTKKLDAMKCPVAADGKVEVVAYVEGPKSREISYINSGTYTVQEYFTKLKIVYQGKTLWETQWTNIPGMLSLQRGENIETKLREASAHPAYGLYQEAVLPEFLQKPTESQNPGQPGAPQTIGQSTITPRGIR
jgi:WD40 repeat protein